MIATLPHYTGGPRRADGELYAQPDPLTLQQLQARVRDYIDAYNTAHEHASLGGMTPAQKWTTSAAPIQTIAPERLRWMLMADETRVVNKDGIHFKDVVFIAPQIVKRGGETLQVRYMPHDLRSIELFTEDGTWLCTAYPEDQLPAADAEAIIQQRRDAAREMGRRRAAANRRARTRIAPLTANGTVQDITAPARRRSERAPSAQRDQQTGELLRVLGLAEQLNKPIPPEQDAQAR